MRVKSVGFEAIAELARLELSVVGVPREKMPARDNGITRDMRTTRKGLKKHITQSGCEFADFLILKQDS